MDGPIVFVGVLGIGVIALIVSIVGMDGLLACGTTTGWNNAAALTAATALVVAALLFVAYSWCGCQLEWRVLSLIPVLLLVLWLAMLWLLVAGQWSEPYNCG